MVPTAVFENYWRFAAERQAIYFRRMTDPTGPWTNDPILATFRFTNAYRASDRVSQYLIREVQYNPDRSSRPSEVFFRTILFKLFNRIETWEELERHLGPLSWESADLDKIAKALDRMMDRGRTLYSAAYIMPSPAFGHKRKHANHLALLARMMDERLPDRIRQVPTLQDVYKLLINYPGIGPFLAFQYAIDLNYASFLTHDESEFVVAGPGAADGIAKCFVGTGGRNAQEVIFWVCERQEEFFRDIGIKFQTLFGRRLQPIDCQNLFCEISKYARVKYPDVRGLSGRTRIKQLYRQAPEPLPRPMFPPRWGLRIPDARSSTKDLNKRVGLFT
ncbi:putative DNA base hypermodification protein [Bradyrhizobium elkanii]|uniref:nucleotide kinase domain-containing protein n=1 Tax=Bradyrhizobium elkanii TaxID=29448 RepID=UPI0027121024|nr:nucleotide kinase domain-containing protein [Bradyrhizobium elkanii]WLA38558.1 putative DNA base hypermodification protein [Bradyrhizobium elkanii]